MNDHPLKKSFRGVLTQHEVNEFALAAHYGDKQKVEEFLKKHKGAIDEKDSQGRTALVRAVRGHKKGAAELLIKNGAAIEQRDPYGMTVLMLAAMYGGTDTVELLLDKGAKVEEKDSALGWTALMWAAKHGHRPTVELLLEKGADLFVKSSTGLDLVTIALVNYHSPLALFLKEHSEAKKKQLHQQWLADTDFSKGLERPLRAPRPLKRAL